MPFHPAVLQQQVKYPVGLFALGTGRRTELVVLVILEYRAARDRLLEDLDHLLT